MPKTLTSNPKMNTGITKHNQAHKAFVQEISYTRMRAFVK